jgi:hypothetical protein
MIDVFTPSNWGWKKENGVWVPHWTSLAPIAASCRELLKCGCKKNCSFFLFQNGQMAPFSCLWHIKEMLLNVSMIDVFMM